MSLGGDRQAVDRSRNVMTTLELDPAVMEEINNRPQAKYRIIEENEVRFQSYGTDDADYPD